MYIWICWENATWEWNLRKNISSLYFKSTLGNSICFKWNRTLFKVRDFKNKLFSPRDLQIMQEATTIYINQFFFLRGFTPELAPFKGFSLTFCVFLMYLFCTGPIIRSGQYSICFIVWGKKTFVKYMDADGLMKILILFLV